jgi:lysophospholipase L1-like esterase
MKNRKALYQLILLLPFLAVNHCFAAKLKLDIKCNQRSLLHTATVSVNPGDPHIQYFGRWDFSHPSEYTSHWGGAYFKVSFTGTTAKIKLGNKSNYYARIDDGPWTSYLNASGTLDLTPEPLTAGLHTLSVAQGKDYNYVFSFQGLLLDAGTKTLKPVVYPYLIEYIGDSITAGYTDPQADVSDYAWTCSENLRCEHTQIAYPGINIVSGYSNAGMSEQYFKQGSLAYPTSPPWDFSIYTPNIIVINLGTNDTNHKIPDSLFQVVYTDFLTNIRNKLPKVEIFVMKTFAGTKAVATSSAVAARNKAGDTHIHYIDTTGWLTRGTDDYTDNTHPSVNGHIKVAKLLQPILQPYLLP